MNTLDLQRKLKTIREKDDTVTRSNKIFNSIMLFLTGSVLGYITRWFYTNPGNGTNLKSSISGFLSSMLIWAVIALAISIYASSPKRAALNVFLFFCGLCIGHYIFCILHGTNNPIEYMITWFILTVTATITAAVMWYGKGMGFMSVAIDTVIIAVMTVLSFSTGHWYIRPISLINIILFIITILMLHRNIKWTTISLILGIIIAIVI